jgi:hypothetical protein
MVETLTMAYSLWDMRRRMKASVCNSAVWIIIVKNYLFYIKVSKAIVAYNNLDLNVNNFSFPKTRETNSDDPLHNIRFKKQRAFFKNFEN